MTERSRATQDVQKAQPALIPPTLPQTSTTSRSPTRTPPDHRRRQVCTRKRHPGSHHATKHDASAKPLAVDEARLFSFPLPTYVQIGPKIRIHVVNGSVAKPPARASPTLISRGKGNTLFLDAVIFARKKNCTSTSSQGTKCLSCASNFPGEKNCTCAVNSTNLVKLPDL